MWRLSVDAHRSALHRSSAGTYRWRVATVSWKVTHASFPSDLQGFPWRSVSRPLLARRRSARRWWSARRHHRPRRLSGARPGRDVIMIRRARRVGRGRFAPARRRERERDLTAELPKTAAAASYLCVPILDAGVADAPSVVRAINSVSSAQRIFIHCAQGHGRTALFAACVLIHRGYSARAAIDAVLAARPGARMNAVQRAFVERFATQASTLINASPSCSSSSRRSRQSTETPSIGHGARDPR